jgi:hypothetical protein
MAKRLSWERATWLVLALAAILRVILVLRGGQRNPLLFCAASPAV